MWRRTLLRSIPAVLVVGLMLWLAGPAAAQDNPGPPGQTDPAPGVPAPGASGDMRVVCVPTGLALTVIQQSNVLAEVMPTGANRSPNDPAAGPADEPSVPRIVVWAPAVVGACAEFEGFWSEGSHGSASTRLLLYRPTETADLADLAPVARDGFETARRGPFIHRQSLRAVARLAEPGTFRFVAVLQASAARPSTDAAAAVSAEDHMRFPFVVEVREREVPVPAAIGTIEGIVEDIEGRPIAGALVAARPVPRLRAADGNAPAPRASAERALPTDLSMVALVDAVRLAQQNAPVARTDENGRYAIGIPPGAYLVHATAPGHVPQWYDGVDGPDAAKAVRVVADQVTGGIDFTLRAAVETPVEPHDGATIKGSVARADGRAVHARIYAVPTAMLRDDPSADPSRLPFPTNVPATATRDDGTYELKVPAGEYIVAMWSATNSAGRDALIRYYDGAETLEAATRVTLAEGVELVAEFVID